jgi:hypothetical protein
MSMGLFWESGYALLYKILVVQNSGGALKLQCFISSQSDNHVRVEIRTMAYVSEIDTSVGYSTSLSSRLQVADTASSRTQTARPA